MAQDRRRRAGLSSDQPRPRARQVPGGARAVSIHCPPPLVPPPLPRLHFRPSQHLSPHPVSCRALGHVGQTRLCPKTSLIGREVKAAPSGWGKAKRKRTPTASTPTLPPWRTSDGAGSIPSGSKRICGPHHSSISFYHFLAFYEATGGNSKRCVPLTHLH